VKKDKFVSYLQPYNREFPPCGNNIWSPSPSSIALVFVLLKNKQGPRASSL
jgi:hypothetical protein